MSTQIILILPVSTPIEHFSWDEDVYDECGQWTDTVSHYRPIVTLNVNGLTRDCTVTEKTNEHVEVMSDYNAWGSSKLFIDKWMAEHPDTSFRVF